MKNIIKLPFFILIFLTISSCQKDDSLSPLPVIVNGQYVRFDITNKRINIDDPNSTFGGMLTTPGNNVVKYNIYIRKKNIYGQAGDFMLLRTVTSFPVDLEFSISDIATALQVPVSSLVLGDTFRTYGESFDASGNRCDFYSLSATVQGAIGMKQGYRNYTDITNTSGMNPDELDSFNNYSSQ